ncbi:MAG: PEP/pyruvate-binding domain-containing protein [Armatimonadota bacterium]|nr:PEP/pyruvate-binding domain-containing protein [Armatimonadota bacterium]
MYASVYLERPRRYFEAIGLNPADEKMAVVIQEVAGQPHGDCYYPTLSGVAQSYNYYPISHMRPEDGVALVALGLGKQVMEGGEAVRFCPRYPQILPQFGSPEQVKRVSQRKFFALDLSCADVDLTQGPDATLRRFPLSRAEADGALDLIGSVVSAADDRVYDGVSRPGTRVVTFARVLKSGAFPLSAILNRLLEMGRESMGSAFEMEFAANLDTRQGREPEFHFLQIRPLVARRERFDIALEEEMADHILCRSRRVMGNGRLENVADVVYIHPERFDRAHSRHVAELVAALNQRMVREGRRYLLMGPGRWGSMDPWIGIPVAWHHISQAAAIVEVPARDLPMEPSQGTHFFHNMTSAGVAYFSLPATTDADFVRWDLLDALSGEELEGLVRHVRLQKPLTIRMDGQTQQGVIALA